MIFIRSFKSLGLGLIAAVLYGCGSDDGLSSASLNITSTEIVSFSGGEIPLEADLVLFWVVPGEGFTEQTDLYISGRGSLSNGSFFVEPPDPILDELVSEDIGVGAGFVLAFPEGQAPAAGKYEEQEFDMAVAPAIGVVNNFAIIYRIENFTSPLLEFARLEGIELWLDLFEDGYSCARAFKIEGRGVDGFEPAECSSTVLSIGITGTGTVILHLTDPISQPVSVLDNVVG